MLEEFAGPSDEVFHVRAVLVSAVVLPPGEFTVEQIRVYRRHLCRSVILFLANVLCSKQTEHRACRDRGHVASLLIEPKGIPASRDAVADEGWTRCAERNQFVGIDGQVAGGLRSELGFRSTVFQEVARHPMVFTGAGEIFHRLAEIPPMKFRAAFTRRPNQGDDEARPCKLYSSRGSRRDSSELFALFVYRPLSNRTGGHTSLGVVRVSEFSVVVKFDHGC